MELKSAFSAEGWTIKYTLSEPTAAVEDPITNIVFVHGTPWSSIVFAPIAKALLSTGRYRVLLYDLPGYGQSQAYSGNLRSSDLFTGDTSVKFQAAALAKLLEHLKLDGKDENAKPALIAHDIAGAIALRAHLFHECEYASLMLWDTNVVLPWGDGFYKLARSEPEVFLQMPPNIFEAVVRAVIQSGCYNPKKLIPSWEDDLAQPWLPRDHADGENPSPEQRSFIRQIAQATDTDVAEMLDQNLYSKVRCPVTILWGEKDTWIPKDKMDQLAEKIKHCLKDFVVVPEAGHLLMIDQPERVTFEVFKWLEQQ